MTNHSFAVPLALAAALTSSHALSAVIVQNTAGPNLSAAGFFAGQSFTTNSGGPWDHITFNFFSDAPATTPAAFGTAFLLDQQYLGTPSNLSSSTPGFLGASTGITGGKYMFPTNLVLDPGVQYFVYENEMISTGISGNNTIMDGQGYATQTALSTFGTFGGFSFNFSASGTEAPRAVPEPSPLLVFVTALFSFGLLRRYRKRG